MATYGPVEPSPIELLTALDEIEAWRPILWGNGSGGPLYTIGQVIPQ